jgi:threonine/homoserine/homoserine lactone efflux protein
MPVVDALLLGLAIGLGAGISPGPLLVLVIAQSLRSGWPAGVLAACSPLVTDALVVAGSLLVLVHLPHRALDVLGVVGGVAVVALGVRTVAEARTATLSVPPGLRTGPWSLHDLLRAAAVNLVSPHPWITWTVALGPLVVRTWRSSEPAAVLLVAGFYVALVGAKIALAVLVDRGRRPLRDAAYRRAVLGAAILLVAAGVALVVEFASTL